MCWERGDTNSPPCSSGCLVPSGGHGCMAQSSCDTALAVILLWVILLCLPSQNSTHLTSNQKRTGLSNWQVNGIQHLGNEKPHPIINPKNADEQTACLTVYTVLCKAVQNLLLCTQHPSSIKETHHKTRGRKIQSVFHGHAELANVLNEHRLNWQTCFLFFTVINSEGELTKARIWQCILLSSLLQIFVLSCGLFRPANRSSCFPLETFTQHKTK